jgi:valyl-tRNA synthetase
MSKSLGTGIDPLDLIEGGPRPPVFAEGGEFPAYGADAVRFGLLAMSSTQDVRFTEERVAQGRQLTNKLFNAARLVLTQTPAGVRLPGAAPAPAAVEDAWILARLERAKADVTDAIEAFEFHRAALRLYDFVYGELCDWYLELVKPRLYQDDRDETCAFALHVIAETLALAHPVIPFVTEELWQHVPGSDGLLMARRWPEPRDGVDGGDAEAVIGQVIGAVTELRGWRDRVGAAPGKAVPARLEAAGYDGAAEHVARLARLEWSDGGEAVATVPVPGGAVTVFASEAVDLEAAARRAAAARERLAAEISRAEGKLGNARFVERAPAEVVQAERDKLARLREELEALG